jgi:tRNA (mo5U34)-methyltransferase
VKSRPAHVRSVEPVDPDRLRAEARSLSPWFHNLHMPGGVQTAPDHSLGDYPAYKWAEIAPHIPLDLTGYTALDVGCNAGFYALELARRGARVTGIDHDPHYLNQARWAAMRLGLEDRADFENGDAYDIARRGEQYDIVLFMGTFYHLRYPLLALDSVARAVRRIMLFQTLTMPGDNVIEETRGFGLADRDRLLEVGWPRMAFLEHAFDGDPTNWWAPNHACVEAVLRSAGLEIMERPGHEVYLCRPSGHGFPHERELRAALGARRFGRPRRQ